MKACNREEDCREKPFNLCDKVTGPKSLGDKAHYYFLCYTDPDFFDRDCVVLVPGFDDYVDISPMNTRPKKMRISNLRAGWIA